MSSELTFGAVLRDPLDGETVMYVAAALGASVSGVNLGWLGLAFFAAAGLV